MPTNEKPTRLGAPNREAVNEKPTNADAVAKLIKRMTASKSMMLQIRKHGTTLHHQEQAKRLSGDDDSRR